MKYPQQDDSISLLWPGDTARDTMGGNGGELGFVADLEVYTLVEAFSMGRKYDKFIFSTLTGLCTDKEAIVYRQDIVDDLLNNTILVSSFSSLLPSLDELASCRESIVAQSSTLLTTAQRFGELELYVYCMDRLAEALTMCGESLRSEGLCMLRDRVTGMTRAEAFSSLRRSIPELKAGMEKMSSVTIGINLDAQLRPCEATIVSVNERKFKGSQFIQTLFSRSLTGPDEFTGISELRMPSEAPSTLSVLNDSYRPLQAMLFGDLHNILNKVLAPVTTTIKQFTNMSTQLLLGLENEIAFYLGVVRLISKIRQGGLPMCRPVIHDDDHRLLRIRDGYYLNLALRRLEEARGGLAVDVIVANDIDFDEGGTVFLLTGPNQGGKTTYLQMIGTIQLLAQAGCHIPANYADIGVADHIFTHFPVEEKPGDNTGRLGEEAKRISEIIGQATSASLVLLNESISSSSPSENLQISRNVVLGMQWIGLRAVFATHLHELAQGLEEWNDAQPQGCPVVSIVAGIDETSSGEGSGRTYKVVRSAPRGCSFAMDIAQRYGLGREQIIQTLMDRGIVVSP